MNLSGMMEEDLQGVSLMKRQFSHRCRRSALWGEDDRKSFLMHLLLVIASNMTLL